LSSANQAILKYASVIGRDFDLKLLETLLTNEKDLEGKLRFLVKMEFIDYKKTYYSFKNEILLKTVYSRLLFSQRKKLHQKVAEYYESLPNYVSYVSLLAYHWDQVIIASKIPTYQAVSQAIKYMKLASIGGIGSTYWFERSLELLQLNVDTSDPSTNVNMNKLKLQVMGMSLKDYKRFPHP